MKRKHLMLLPLVSSLLFSCAPTSLPYSGMEAEGAPIEESIFNGHGIDFSSNLFAYRVKKMMLFTPNTIEALVKIPTNVRGFVGNLFTNEDATMQGFISMSVNENGNLRIDWNGGEYMMILDEVDLRTNQWTFLSFVRDPVKKEARIYLNGELAKTYSVDLPNVPSIGFHQIGSDAVAQVRNKCAFKGEIKEVYGYKSALDDKAIKLDFADTTKKDISYETRGTDLAFSYSLQNGQDELLDKSIYKQNMKKVTLDYFYRQDLYPTKDYTFAVIPDPQMVVTYHDHYGDMTGALDTTRDFLNANVNRMKIDMTMCVGDLSNMQVSTSDKQKKAEWTYVSSIFNGLNSKVKQIVTPGNHDYDYTVCSKDHSLSYFNEYFPISNYNTRSYWGGSLDPTQLQNSYYLSEVAGVKYLFITMDFGPEDYVIDWANEVAESYPDRRIVLLTHNMVNPFGTITTKGDTACATSYGWVNTPGITINDASDVYEKFVKKHKNMFMTFSGHLTTDDIVYHESIGDNGNVIMDFLINGQGIILNDGLESLLGLFTFDEKEQVVYQDYYSTYSQKSFNIQNHVAYSFKGYTDILSSDYYNQDGSLKEGM
ncbi:MAG: metallophosphoesterase [Bacilli bacterium]|nr:metallophosphoesterase [Bacilli bacterium]